MTPRRKHKVDLNQAEVIAGLRDVPGVTVAITSMLGEGFPDFVVGFRGRNYLIELKSDEKATLTEREQEFFDMWTGQIARCDNLDEVLLSIGATK